MIDALLALVAEQAGNEVFSGGLALGALGAAVALAARVARTGIGLMLSRLLPSLHIDGRAPLFRTLEAWLHEHPYSRSCRNLSVAHHERFHLDDGRDDPVRLVPGTGSHVLRHRGTWLWLRRESVEGESRRTDRDVVTITALSLRADCLRRFIGELIARHERRAEAITIHGPSEYGDWQEITRASRRPLASVITTAGLGEVLLDDARQFLDRQDWYAERGIPWRRGYLFQGPPGTGKTSLIRALASELEIDIAILDLSSPRLDDGGLRQLLAAIPPQTALVLEDIDAAAPSRQPAEGKVTLSGLLNALDGLAAAEGRLLFMTTNHPDRLDPALIRPGRADHVVEIGPLGPAEAGRMILRFHPDRLDIARLAEAALAGHRIPAAALQEYLLRLQDDPGGLPAALASLDSIVTE